MKKGISIFFVVLIFGSIWLDGFAQTKADLERKRKQKEEEIRYTKKLIQETNQKQKASLQYLDVLNNQIKNRESLINTIGKEMKYLNEQIQENTEHIKSLSKDLENLKKEYASMVVFAYKNRNTYNKIGFIFSAETFNQSFKRMKLIQNYSDYRKRQMDLIIKTKKTIQIKTNELNRQRLEKVALLDKETQEKMGLLSDKEEQSELFDKLKKKEKDLRKQLKEKERIANELNKALEKLIKAEIERANKEKTKTSKETSKSSKISSMLGPTPESLVLSQEFMNNKQKLPWPVERGFISESFGKHEYENLEGVYIYNNGVNIRTSKEATARAVFNGEVKNIINIPGSNYTVLIKHGEYFTVYSNLEYVNVRVGEKVKTKQVLGTVFFNEKTGIAELHLEIWRNYDKLDPAQWLFPK
jgi:septal ring factor EnvC (AmiA/AmiB activator)